MKLKGFWFKDTELARLISPTPDRSSGVWVPQDRTTKFKKLATTTPDVLPRECVFEVEGWLAQKPEFADFKPV
jgi:hypothetical protein